MQPTERQLPYENAVHFGTLEMRAMRDTFELCHEGDMVNIFQDDNGNMLAIAFGLKNMGFYIGVVMALGAPIGFGRVVYTVGDKAFVYWSEYPEMIEASENGTVSEGDFDALP